MIGEKIFTKGLALAVSIEYSFGPFTFYEDGFKIVAVPYLGMEHESSVTYGNAGLSNFFCSHVWVKLSVLSFLIYCNKSGNYPYIISFMYHKG